MSNPVEKLKQAKEMLDMGLILPDEYEAIKFNVMAELGMNTKNPAQEEKARREEKARIDKEAVRAREVRQEKPTREVQRLEKEYAIEQKRQLSIEKKTKEIVVGGFFGFMGTKFPMVEIPAGWFMMGALPNDEDASSDEKPRHKVTLTKSFWMGKYPCTQELYEKVMGTNPSKFKGSIKPVEQVSWCDAVLFCNKLSEMEGLEPVYVLPEPFDNDNGWSKKVKWNKDATGYRLPTEAEWEYCVRAGQSFKYSGSNSMDEVGWYEENSGGVLDGETFPVGEKKSNGFGLYDMSGNVWEWVWDSWKREYGSSTTDLVYVDMSSSRRVRRGGSWGNSARSARVSYRYWGNASRRYDDQGFRFLRTIP